MLLIALYCVALGAISLVTGLGLLVRLRLGPVASLVDRALAATWLGFAVLSLALLAAGLVVPVGAAVGAIVAIILLAIAVSSAQVRVTLAECTRAARQRSLAGVGILLAGVCLFASERPTFWDTGMYQYAESQWLQQFGVVRGLSLLHNRLGTISPWYALLAPVDVGAFTGRLVHGPMAFVLWLGLVHAAVALARVVEGRARIADRFAAVALGGWLVWMLVTRRPDVVPSPDIATSLLLLVAAWALLLRADGETRDMGDGTSDLSSAPDLLPVLLAGAAAGMRFSALPAAAVLAAGYVALGPRPRRRIVAAGVALAALIGPTVAATFVTTGCPLFPATASCVDRDWAIGAHGAEDFAHFVRWFARSNDGNGGVGYPPTDDGGGWRWWLPGWIPAHIVAIALMAFTVVVLVRSDALVPPRQRMVVRWLAAVGALGMVAVFLSAPSNRFLIPYGLLAPAVVVAVRRRNRAAARAMRAGRGLAAVGLALAAVTAVRSHRVHLKGVVVHTNPLFDRLTSTDLLVPPTIGAPDRVYVAHSGALTYYTPDRPAAAYRPMSYRNSMDARCWSTPLPCTPQLAVPGVTLADSVAGLARGFVRRPAAPTIAAPQPPSSRTTSPTPGQPSGL